MVEKKEVKQEEKQKTKKELVKAQFFAPTKQANVLKVGSATYMDGEIAELDKETIKKLNISTTWTVKPLSEVNKEEK